MTLSLEAARVGSAVVLHCQGRGIFRSEARALAGLISEVLPAAQHLVVDLAGVITLDSDALGELVLTHMWADAAGYSLKFASASGPVRQLFESTNLVSVFDLYESVPEALAGLRHEEVQSA
jgi:anti-anti-sigma factor